MFGKNQTTSHKDIIRNQGKLITRFYLKHMKTSTTRIPIITSRFYAISPAHVSFSDNNHNACSPYQPTHISPNR